MRNMYGKNSPAKRAALGGIVTLLNITCLYLVLILLTNRIFFFWLSTIFIASVVIEIGTIYAFLTYCATSILGFFIIPNKLVLIPYVIYFGYYGIIKYYIERINSFTAEWITKLILFNISIYATYKIFVGLMFTDIEVKLPLLVVILLLEIGYIIYDYFYSILVKYYKYKLRKFL